MADPGLPFTISLVVATRDRYSCIAARLPTWTSAGFDEVVIVDASYDIAARQELQSLCEKYGSTYVATPRTLRDNRSLARNLGARVSRGSWVLFQDDDDDAVQKVDKAALERSARGKDWLTGPRGEHIVWHRRGAFLAFGGYPEDMVAAEDWVMSNRARANGAGGLEPAWYQGEVRPASARDDPISRMRNAFWYGYTMLLYLIRCPKRNEVMLGDARRFAIHIRSGLREPRHFAYLCMGMFGRALSPLYCLRVAISKGPKALRKESFHGWQEIR